MATNPTIKPRRGTAAPGTGSISQNELAVDTTNKRIYIGAADGSGTLIGSAPGGSDTQVQFNDGGNLGGDSGLTYNKTTDTLVAGRVETTGFEAKTVGGDEGGEILLGKAVTNTTLTGTGVTIDVYRDKLRFFEQGGTARGAYIDISAAGAGVSTNLIASSASPGGSDTYVQFNDGSTFGGDAGLTYNKTTDSLTITGDLAVNGSDITTTGTGTATLFNTNALTLNLGGAATAITIGDATTATTTVRGGTLVGNVTTQNLFNTTATTVNLGGAATTLSIGAATGTATINNANTVVTGDLAVNGGDITTSSGSATLFNSTATTLSIGGAATTFNIGGASSATINLGKTDGTTVVDMNSCVLREVEMRSYFETEGTVTYTGGMTQDLSFDLSTGNVFVYTTTGSISTFTVTNIPSKANTAVGFTVVLTCGNALYGVTFDSFTSGGPVWAGGTPPTASNTLGRTDIVSYVTYDAGTTWYGMVGGLNFY